MLTLLLATALSCALVVLTPGPGVLTVLHIGTGSGRRPAAHFLLGHLAGDLMWALLALIALRWVQLLSPAVFTVLTVASALYLVYLGIRALAAASAPDSGASAYARRPLAHGAVFGLTNPKSYPVTLAIFASVIAGNIDLLTAATVPLFLLASALGCITADALLVWIVGLHTVRKLYARAAPWITRGVAFLFFGFAAYSLLHLR
ncbi:LysE family translocator [Streptomyces sp. NPDC002514]|uniref:LysE family translocator n=1 Tax=Streptomyces sp. NPDC001270 TaxID=3364554 RepID=UPI0036AF4C21